VTARILVANRKGGCGKTTIATNLAAAFAAGGLTTALADVDRQRSGLDWLGLRPATAAPIARLDWHKEITEPPGEVQRLVIDAPAALRMSDVEDAQTLRRELAVDRAVAEPRRDRLAEPPEEGLEALRRLRARAQPVRDQRHTLLALPDRLQLLKLREEPLGAALVEHRGEDRDHDEVGGADELVHVPHPQVRRRVDDQALQGVRRVADLLAPVERRDRQRPAVAQAQPGEAGLLPVDLGEAGGEAALRERGG